MSDQPSDPAQSHLPGGGAADPRVAAMIALFGEAFYERYNEPVVFTRLDLATPVAQSMLRRDFGLLSRTLLLESVYRRRQGFNVEILNAFASTLQTKLAQITSFFAGKNDQIQAIFRTQGVEPESAYIKVQHYPHVPIIATYAKSFIQLLKLMDDYYQLTGCAALHGLLDGNQRRAAELQARKAVRAFLAVVRQEAIKLRRESNRIKATLEGGAIDDDHQLEASVDNAVAQNAAEDDASGDHIHGDEASAILDGIAATGNAAVQAAGRKPDATTLVAAAA